MGSDFNKKPDGLKEIDLKEWSRIMFIYQTRPKELRQVTNDGHYTLIMFDVPNIENKKLGVAVMNDWHDNTIGKNRPEAIIRYCKYGTEEDWKIFEQRFAHQFAGDNS